ncbi:MAG TPA: hypothetical protein VF918_12270 [Anaerolineales bacterium]
MSTLTLIYPKVIRFRRTLIIGLIAILILASLALIAVAILDRSSSTTRDAYQADQIPVVQNGFSPILVQIAPTANTQPVPSEKPVLASIVASKPPVPPNSVPTPPL